MFSSELRIKYIHRRGLKTDACSCLSLCSKSSVVGNKVDIKLQYIEYFIGGGGLPLLSTWTGGGGDVGYPRLSNRGGGGVKIGLKLVHVVVECPLNTYYETRISLHVIY